MKLKEPLKLKLLCNEKGPFKRYLLVSFNETYATLSETSERLTSKTDKFYLKGTKKYRL